MRAIRATAICVIIYVSHVFSPKLPPNQTPTFLFEFLLKQKQKTKQLQQVKFKQKTNQKNQKFLGLIEQADQQNSSQEVLLHYHRHYH